MQRPFVSILLIVPFFLASCEKEQMGDCLKSHGERVSKGRKIKGVRVIELHDHVELLIKKSSNEGVKVEAGANTIPLIKTRKKGERLVIRDENTCHWVRSYDRVPRVIVRTQALRRLEDHGTADIHSEDTIRRKRFDYDQWNGMGDVELNFDTEQLELKLHTGAGNLICEGRSDQAYLYIGGSGFMKLRDLECGSVAARNNGTGNIRVHVRNELTAQVESIGSIFFEGNGELVSASNSGSGKISRKAP